MNLIDRIGGWARAAPDRPAHVSGDRVLTWSMLERRASAVASHLARTLPDDGSPVVVLGHKEPEMLAAFLGAVKAGHPYVPLDSVLPRRRIEGIVTAAGARCTLTPESVRELPDGAAPLRDRPWSATDPYYVMFTSGSTGEPKGVVITLGCLTTFVEWMLLEQAFSGSERFLNVAPFSFDLSVMDTYLSLATGGTLVSVTRDEIANPRRLYEVLAACGATAWVSTPSFAQMCAAEPSFGPGMLPRLRRFLFCGETLPPALARDLLERFPEAAVWNTYGPTETTVATTSIRVDREVVARYSPLPVGYAMPSSRILVVDEAGQPLRSTERGEIVIAGPSVSPGYLGRADLTARSFFLVEGQRAYRTGDRGWLQDGMLFLEGRMDDQVKIRGYRIELGDVESHLRALPEVRDAVVVAVKQGTESLTAFVILSQRPMGSDFETTRALRARLRERLPEYMVPLKFRFVDLFPMNANGKVDRARLVESTA